MTMARASTAQLMDVAQEIGCVGVELRNDIRGPLFYSKTPHEMRDEAERRGLRILALAEVYGFNSDAPDVLEQVEQLAGVAQALGAEGLVLIPTIADGSIDRTEQRHALRNALVSIRPILEKHNVLGLIEPLGFAHSTLRFKSDVAEILDELGTPDCFGVVHDTFHHALSEETEVFTDLTRIVHVSGVRRKASPLTALRDEDRGLVDADDQIGNRRQMAELDAAGFKGPYSIEAFAPDVHALDDVHAALTQTLEFMTAQMTASAA
jgi:2-keto-myo-inositol isomerase